MARRLGIVAVWILLISTALASASPGSGTPDGALSHAQPLAGPSVTTYGVNLSVPGLPTGASWNLTVLGQTWTAKVPWILLQEPNGTYSYQASSDFPSGRSVGSGSFVVAGHPITSVVTLVTLAPSVGGGTASASSTSFGLLGPLLAVVILVVVIAAVFVGVVARRKTTRFSPSPPPRSEAVASSSTQESSDTPGQESPDPLRHML